MFDWILNDKGEKSTSSPKSEEAQLMGRGFSDATATLLRIGIDVRRSQRAGEKAT